MRSKDLCQENLVSYEFEKKFDRILRRHILSKEALLEIIRESQEPGKYIEELLLERGVPKHEIMRSISEYFGCPAVEYNEGLMAPYLLTVRLDMEKQMRGLWFPLCVKDDEADVIAYRPYDIAVINDVKKTLKVEKITFRAAIASDLIRIIENNFDVNPHFGFSGGRTPLALVRTEFAYRRSAYAFYRTLLAKGRTGLAFLRTGVSFLTIALLFLRILGAGIYSVIEFPLMIAGIAMIFDGIRWYLPSRSIAKKPVEYECTEPTWGTTVLEQRSDNCGQRIERTCKVKGAEKLRDEWEALSPVMRRRFLASDRTDLAEERTALAGYRTLIAKGRTGLAFTRTGIALSGLGIGLIRYFHASGWTALDLCLIAAGILMILEGFHWYFGGRRTWIEGVNCALTRNKKESIWDFVIPFRNRRTATGGDASCPPVRPTDLPGIWATTGLALERTVLAERRNVMARLRTIMAHSRTGLAFKRTGISICGVGAGLMFYFGTASIAWTAFNALLIIAGILLIIDGFYWAVPAERMRIQYPYCYGDMEITLPDYGVPARLWRKAVFSHDPD